MTLAAYETKCYAKIFGETRRSCHYPLLTAILMSNVDVLLPILYYACSDYDMNSILTNFDSVGSKCLHTLIGGKTALELATSRLIAELPEELGIHDGGIVCPANGFCPEKLVSLV